MHTAQLKSWAVFAVPVLVVVGLFVVLAASQPKSTVEGGESGSSDAGILTSCIQHANVALHIHPTLTIMVNGTKQAIPSDIGIEEGGCMHPVHTHDASGAIHIEYLYPVDFTLGDFFTLWGKTFSQSELVSFLVDDTHVIKMTVNGEPSEEYQNLVLRDEDEIVISYETIE